MPDIRLSDLSEVVFCVFPRPVRLPYHSPHCHLSGPTSLRQSFGTRISTQGSNIVYLTEEGLDKLRKELRFLKTKERTRISRSIQEAREKGDLSENAEYDAAKEAQGLLEARIAKMETTVSQARLVDEKQVDPEKAYILSNVRVKNHGTGSERTFQLVSAAEADIRTGKISVTSPIGSALLGKAPGDVIEVDVPAGQVKMEVLEISR